MVRTLILISALLMAAPAGALVDMRNANYSDSWTDIIAAGTGYDLRIKRSYNSRTLFNGIFGFGWCSDFETTLNVTPENNIQVTECGGGLEVTFRPADFNSKIYDNTIKEIMKAVKKRNPDKGPAYFKGIEAQVRKEPLLREEFSRQLGLKGKVQKGTTYVSNGRQNETIKFSGSIYKRTLSDGTFQKFNKKGQLTHMYDKNGNFLKINYKKKRIHNVVDNQGRKLNFKYYGETPRVKQITGPNGLKSSYVYKGEDLITVKNMWGNTFRFSYDDLHNLIKIAYPDKTHKALTYNKDRDWVTSFRDRRGCKETYQYIIKDNDTSYYKSTVKKICKGKVVNRSTYEFWHKKRFKGHGRFLARSRSNNNGKVRDIVYHERFGRPISITQNGRKVKFKYYKNGLIKTKTETNRRMAYKYKNACNKISSVQTKFYGPSKRGKARPVVRTTTTSFKYEAKKCNLIYAKNSDGLTANIAYDRNGRINKITDQARKEVLIKYDAKSGKPSVVTRPGLGTIRVSYKRDGQIDKINSKEGPTVAVQVASIFNSLLEIISVASADISI